MDFVNSADAATREINGWVGQQTGGKVTELVGPGVLDFPNAAGAGERGVFQGEVGDAV